MNGNAATTNEYLAALPDWQRLNLNSFRELVLAADPTITEEIKWGVPVFLKNGKLVFAMSAFKAHTKYNFIQNGALLDDTKKLFNNGLESKKSRGIDLHKGETVNQADLADLIAQSLAKL